MPELPEMEHYRRMLEQRIGGKRIEAVDITREKSINVDAELFRQLVCGQTVRSVARRAKLLRFELENGYALLLHLMLGGWLFFGSETQLPARTRQLTFRFDHGLLCFIGLRLGYLHLLPNREAEARLAGLGPEPLETNFTLPRFLEMMEHKRGALKSALTDQRFIAGIGNCYADEICFAAGVRPDISAAKLTIAEKQSLHAAIGQELRRALDGGGYMEHPFYAGDALTGAYGERLAVYDRGGEPCVRCARPLLQLQTSGKKAFCCTYCQRSE